MPASSFIANMANSANATKKDRKTLICSHASYEKAAPAQHHLSTKIWLSSTRLTISNCSIARRRAGVETRTASSRLSGKLRHAEAQQKSQTGQGPFLNPYAGRTLLCGLKLLSGLKSCDCPYALDLLDEILAPNWFT